MKGHPINSEFSPLKQRVPCLLCLIFVLAILAPKWSWAGEENLRIAALTFTHETTTFLPNETTVEDFIYPGSPAKGEELLRYPLFNGFVKAARENKGIELVGIESPLLPAGGSGSGWIAQDAFDHIVGNMVKDLKAQGPFDGVYLALHGALAVRGIPRPEAELARRVREVVPKAVIVGTFDPHGNEDEHFFKYADMAFTAKYYPHYDIHLQGERAARALIRAIRGDYRPVQAVRKVPILTPTVVQWSGQSPWMDLIQRALIWEARQPDVYVNLFYGYPWADVPDVGMAIEVIANGDAALAERVADDMAGFAWQAREGLVNAANIQTMADGVALAKQALKTGKAPIVLADYSDRSGNATWLLDEVIRQDLSDTVIATLMDRRVIKRLVAEGVKPGDSFDEHVGGYADDSAGKPVRLRGNVLAVNPNAALAGDVRTWITVGFGNNNAVILSPHLEQVVEPAAVGRAGIDPGDYQVFAIKSRVHFRRGFDDTGYAKTILLVEPPQPYLGTVHLKALDYKQIDLQNYYPYGATVTYPNHGKNGKQLE